jgi:WD40 repeat protein
MAALSRLPLYFLLVVAVVAAPTVVKAGPLDDLLPPPARQIEKRSLGANDERIRRSYYDGRGGAGAVFSPDGKYLLAVAAYQGMALWDASSGRMIGQFANLANFSPNEGMVAAFTPDGKQLVAAAHSHMQSSSVSLLDVAKRERIRSLDEDANDTPISALAVAPDGKTIALAGGFGRRNQALTVFLWDMASGDEVGRIDGLVPVDPTRRNVVPSFQALAYSPDGRTLAVLLEGRIILVELASSKARGELTFPTSHDARPDRGVPIGGALAYAPDGRTLMVGCSDGAIRRFDLRTGKEIAPLGSHTGSVVALHCSSDGKSVNSYGIDGQFYVWRADSGRDWKPKEGPLTDVAVDALWDVLRTDDPGDLFGAVQALAASPRQSVPLLTKRLAPVAKSDGERIDQLIKDLQTGEYNARKRAVVELRKIGAAAGPALRKSQERGGYDELIQRLQAEFANQAPPAEQTRSLRALAILERIGDTDARKLLETLGEGSPEAALTVQAKSALDRLRKAEPAKADPAPEALWDALAQEDSAAAYRAVRAFANRPGAAALLQERLKETGSNNTFDDDPMRVTKLIAELDSDDFNVRDQASKQLRTLGRFIVPALRKALEGKPSLESKRRLDEILDEATKGGYPPEMLRVARALEALELIGGADARQAMQALAKDADSKWLRDAADASLQRQQPANP